MGVEIVAQVGGETERFVTYFVKSIHNKNERAF